MNPRIRAIYINRLKPPPGPLNFDEGFFSPGPAWLSASIAASSISLKFIIKDINDKLGDRCRIKMYEPQS